MRNRETFRKIYKIIYCFNSNAGCLATETEKRLEITIIDTLTVQKGPSARHFFSFPTPVSASLSPPVLMQGQRSLGSRSKVKLATVGDIGRFAHVKVKLLHLALILIQILNDPPVLGISFFLILQVI